jgi:hypothetical protein
MAATQRKAAVEFSGTFPDTTVRDWKKMVRDWQENPSRPNPYVSKERGMFAEHVCGLVLSFYQHQNSPRLGCG